MNTFEFEGVPVYWEVSPCCFMYPAYGMQLQISLKAKPVNAESIFAREPDIKVYGESREAVMTSAEAFLADWLALNGLAPLRKAIADWAKIHAQFEIDQEKQRQIGLAKDADMKAKGFTHKFVGWIHPAQGDDYMVLAYTEGNPDKKTVTKWLKNSTVKDDYQVSEL